MPVKRRRVDPIIHESARRHSWRCVAIIENLLRQEELPEAAREFYLLAVEDMKRLRRQLVRQGR